MILISTLVLYASQTQEEADQKVIPPTLQRTHPET